MNSFFRMIMFLCGALAVATGCGDSGFATKPGQTESQQGLRTTALQDVAGAWIRCAAEGVAAPGDTCSFSGTRQVRYGIPGAYTIKVATGSINCSDGAFGVTVVTPYQNFCDYSSTTVSTQVTWTRCAAEGVAAPGDTCSFSGTRQVRYGIPGAYTIKVATGSINCSDGAFGVTVATPYQNFCDYSSATTSAPPASTPAPTPTPTPAQVTWTRCAAEGVSAPGDTCSFSGTRQVRYGIPGAYTIKVATGSINCSDGAFGVTVATPYQNFCDYSSATTSAPPASTPAPSGGAAGPRVSNFTASGPINATAGQVISGVRIQNANGPCITINAPNVRVVDSDIGPCGGEANILVTGANATIEHNFIHNGGRGVLAHSTSGVTTSKNRLDTFYGPFPRGTAIEYDYMGSGGVDGNVVTGQNYASDVISMFQSSNMRLTNNNLNVGVQEPSAAAFTMGDATNGADPGSNNYVAGNIVYQTGGVPAGVFGSSGNTILERNCLTAGIQAYNYSGVFVGVTVRNNVINIPASFVPDTSVINGWPTNINSTNCALVP